jgi:glycosyltransferase involved in cell wall biosynthesis
MNDFDVAYLTIDSIQEGVGRSQIVPLLSNMATLGLKVHLVSFEKVRPSNELKIRIRNCGIDWKPLSFGRRGFFGGAYRLFKLTWYVPRAKVLHARSDIPAVAGILSQKGPVLWDVRSLWGDQRSFSASNRFVKLVLKFGKILEFSAARHSDALSTLTEAVIPILRERHKRIPEDRITVPTTVDLKRFTFSPELPDEIRGLYSGTYNEYYDLGLSESFTIKLKEIENLEIHWARPFESNVEKLNVGEDKIFSVEQPQMADVIPNYSFGLSICSINAGDSLKAAMPTKVAEFLACGRPMVINKGLGDYDGLIEEFNAGVVLDGTAEDLEVKARKMSKILRDPKTPERCRALAERHLGMESGVLEYIKLYSKLNAAIRISR